MPTVRNDVPLAPYTTFGLGGPARHLIEATGEAEVVAALRWAEERSLPTFVLGGGSNLVVADGGWDGLVVRMALRGVHFADVAIVEAAAGEPWDALVEASVRRGLAGLECLSGIPGLVGATPIQNVGAYGQEVADTVRAVRALDRRTGGVVTLPAEACGFAYRDSAFKRDPERHVVLAVTFALRPGGAPTVRYAELRAALADRPSPTLADARAAVLALRRQKGMVFEGPHPIRSAGSFFTNPILDEATAAVVATRAVALGLVAAPADLPGHPAGPGAVKLSAGWLIERAGLRGFRDGPVGVSARHALSLVHHGGGTTADLLRLARHVRDTVRDRFGVTLVPEPVLLGGRWDEALA